MYHWNFHHLITERNKIFLHSHHYFQFHFHQVTFFSFFFSFFSFFHFFFSFFEISMFSAFSLTHVARNFLTLFKSCELMTLRRRSLKNLSAFVWSCSIETSISIFCWWINFFKWLIIECICFSDIIIFFSLFKIIYLKINQHVIENQQKIDLFISLFLLVCSCRLQWWWRRRRFFFLRFDRFQINFLTAIFIFQSVNKNS